MPRQRLGFLPGPFWIGLLGLGFALWISVDTQVDSWVLVLGTGLAVGMILGAARWFWIRRREPQAVNTKLQGLLLGIGLATVAILRYQTPTWFQIGALACGAGLLLVGAFTHVAE